MITLLKLWTESRYSELYALFRLLLSELSSYNSIFSSEEFNFIFVSKLTFNVLKVKLWTGLVLDFLIPKFIYSEVLGIYVRVFEFFPVILYDSFRLLFHFLGLFSLVY